MDARRPRDAGQAVEALLRPLGDEIRADKEKRYMKSQLRFVGAGSAGVKAVTKQLLAQHRDASDEAWRGWIDAMVRHDVFDVRSVGIEALQRLGVASARRPARVTGAELPWVIDLVRHTAAWAHVDPLATNVIGPVIDREPGCIRHLAAWAVDPSFWVRRTSLLAQERALKRGEGDFALFEALAVPMLGEKEFFVRKAIGWVLRETSKKRPALVRGFVERHGPRMSGVSRRAAVKYLGEA